MVFTYTVQSRDDDNDGISIRANAITSPATDFGIKDALSDWPGGNMAYLEHASLTADPAHKVGNTGDDTSPNPDPTEPPIPTPTNHEPTGKPVIAGIAQEKQTLTAQVSGIADQNGLTNTTFTYQWIRVQNNADTNISNATGHTYTLTSNDVGNTIKVRVSFTDDQGYQEVVNSAPTETVAEAPNSPATGPPIISGKAEVDKTLAAVTSRISDDDGLTQVVYAYQWIRGDGNTDTDIQGANTASYTLTDADQGKYIKVRVTFTDDNQNPEQLTSRQTAAVTAPLTLLKALTISPGTLTPAFENSTGTYNVPDVSNIDERITIVTRTAAGSTPTFVKAQVAFRVCSSTGTSCPWTYYDEDNNVIPPLTDADNDLDGFQVDLDVGNNKLMIQVNSTDPKEYESYRFTITRAEETQESQPPEPADKPTGLTGTVSHDAVSLTWDDPADESITGYQILRRNKALHQTGEFLVHLDNTGNTDTTYVDENVEPETRYVYRIKARNNAGLSQRSKKFDANTPAIPHNTNSAATGTPAVNGTAQVGETLTADTSDIADADGLANVSYHYQWIANDGNSDTDIAGETGINYTLVDTDEGQTIKVQVFFTDDAGNDESLTSQATAQVAAAAPTKPPGIPRSLTATANADGTVTLSWDAPNNDSVTGYQILRRRPSEGEKTLLIYVNNTGTTATEYTDNDVTPDVGHTYRVKAINAAGLSRQSKFASVTPTQPAEPAQNSPATGRPTISGTPQVGETLTADTSGIADADGLDNSTFSYQWLSDDADIAGATASTYPLVSDDEGKTLKVRVSFTDDAANDETLTSAATGEVEALPNRPATGAPSISGTAQVGELLTADTSGIADADGLTNVTYSYRWIANDGSSDTDIAGETGITYTLVETDEGKTIKVQVSFTDDADNDESLTSQATARVAAAAPTEPPGIPRNLTGTANADGTVTLRWDTPNNDSVTGYQILRRSPTLGEKKLLVYVNDTGTTATEYTDSNVVPNELYAYRVKAINAVGLSRQSEFVNVTPAQPAEPAQNSAATGAPTISGTAQVGETLTADTSGIADADGLTNVTYSYQWIPNDGSFDADNQDAPGSSYTLVEADEGKIIKVEVSFTDDAGNGESLTSAATAVVAARPNTPATGAPTISGTAQVGETLTASTSGIGDADGMTNAAFSYQWIRSDGAGGTDITDATDSSYTLVDADEGKTIKVKVSFADDEGNDESLTSAATAAVAAEDPQSQELPAKPTGLTGTVSYNAVSLSWDDLGDASVTGYQVLRRDRALHEQGVFLVHVDDTGSASPEYVDRDVALGVRYVYRIKARNAAGLSEQSKRFDADMPVVAPDLLVSTPTLEGGNPTVGTSFTLAARVLNQGGAESAATTVRFYRSADATITTSDTEVGTGSVSVVAVSGVSTQSIDLTAPSDAGTYYYGACVDAVTGESSTTNNCSSALTVTVEEETSTAPDLVVSASILNSSYIDVGSTVTLRTTVRNQGSGESDATTLRYYRSTDYRAGVSGATEVGTASVGALAAGGSSYLSIDLTPPLVADTYYFVACADAVSDESDTTNNCSYWSSVTVDPPDLTVSVSQDGANLVVGESFTLKARVRNSDIGGSSATTVRFYRSTDATITTSDTELGTASVGALAANGSSYLPIDLTAPSTAGTYYYGACVDTVPGESDTTNNCSRALTVTLDATAAPDLIVYRPYHSAGNLLVGASFTLNATVKNQGSAASGSTTLRYYRSTDDTITTSDTALGTDSVSSIASGGTSAQSIDLTAPSEAGTYYYGVCVDAVTDEAVTSNNCSDARAVSVDAEAAPDLYITGLFAVGPLNSSYFTSLSAWVKNQGSGSSDATTLRFYRSTDEMITTSDTELGTAAVGGLSPSGTSSHGIRDITRPSEAGTYYYGACVDAVPGESDTTNNCSNSMSYTVE